VTTYTGNVYGEICREFPVVEVAPAVMAPSPQHSDDSHGRGASAEKSRESFVDYYWLLLLYLCYL
jgi:hypothetical protein